MVIVIITFPTKDDCSQSERPFPPDLAEDTRHIGRGENAPIYQFLNSDQWDTNGAYHIVASIVSGHATHGQFTNMRLLLFSDVVIVLLTGFFSEQVTALTYNNGGNR